MNKHETTTAPSVKPTIRAIFRRLAMKDNGKAKVPTHTCHVNCFNDPALALVAKVIGTRDDTGHIASYSVVLPSAYGQASVEAMPGVFDVNGKTIVAQPDDADAMRVDALQDTIQQCFLAYQRSDFKKSVQPVTLPAV